MVASREKGKKYHVHRNDFYYEMTSQKISKYEQWPEDSSESDRRLSRFEPEKKKPQQQLSIYYDFEFFNRQITNNGIFSSIIFKLMKFRIVIQPSDR